MAGRKKSYRHTAYDDAFRTIETECDDALLPLLNHMFGESYDRTAQIIRLRNEQFVEHKGKEDEKRITDSHFRVRFHDQVTDYHLECESSGYSGSILVRMFQYAVQAAIDTGEQDHYGIIIRLPRSGLLVLRDKGAPPERVTITLQTPGGEVSYEAPVICEADYTLEDIFSKKLYFLLPFYFFNLEGRMELYERDETAMEEFEEIYCDILERLRDTDEEDLSLRSKGVIIRHIETVTRRLAANRRKVTGKVGEIMGGRVVKMDWLERFDAAFARGETAGEARGEGRTLVRIICRKLRKGKDPMQIAEDLEEDEARVRAICNEAERFAPDYDEEQVFEAVMPDMAVQASGTYTGSP